MKRRLVVILVLALSLVVLGPTSDASVLIPCDQANAACESFADADMLSCVTVYGDSITPDQFKACTAHAVHIYQGCMEAHGCPIVN